jgi:hypothetical protein
LLSSSVKADLQQFRLFNLYFILDTSALEDSESTAVAVVTKTEEVNDTGSKNIHWRVGNSTTGIQKIIYFLSSEVTCKQFAP